MTYAEAKARAQTQADATGYDHGVELLGGEYRAWMLPQKRNRYGHELRCEVVYCTDLQRCQPGHGPCANGG